MTAILQAVFAVLIGCGVYMLWKRVAKAGPSVYWIVTLGVLIRAVAGQMAFWVSYLRLPVARSLQIGDGLWIFAVDATVYYGNAVHAAAGGPAAIAAADKTMASVFFVQTLASLIYLLGAVTSVALLLNLAAYLGCCWILLSFGDPARHRGIIFALAALSFSPSIIFWTLQPLKDTLFLFLVAAFFGAARLWQQLWSNRERQYRFALIATTTIVMTAAVYGISGIRWYFGIVVVLAALLFVFLMMFRSPQRWGLAANAAVLLPLLGAAFFSGAGPYVPVPVREAILGRDLLKHVELPSTLIGYVAEARAGFERAGGATSIKLGRTSERIQASLSPAPAAPAPVPAPPPAAAATLKPVSMASAMVEAPVRAPQPPAAAAAPPPVQPAPVEGGASSGRVTATISPLGRLLAGATAVVLPRSIAQRLGILEVAGGHGLWIFVEADTIVFDIVLIVSLVALVRARRRGDLRAPLFWMVLIVTIAVGGALAYAVTNFGTLFRHRNMILLGLALLPLTTINSGAEKTPAEDSAPA